MTQEWVCWKCGATLAALPAHAFVEEFAQPAHMQIGPAHGAFVGAGDNGHRRRERCPALPTHPFLRHAVALVSPPIMIYARPRVESIPCSGRRLQRRPRL